MFGLDYALQSLQSDLVQHLAVLIIHEYLSQIGANQQFFGTGGPRNHGYSVVDFLTPFSVTLDSTDDHVAVLIGDANLAAVGTPLHVLDEGSLSVVDHLFDPLSVVFHENDDCTRGVTGSEFSVFFIPDNNGEIACVIGEVCAFVALRRGVALCFEVVQFDEFEKSFVCADGQPALVEVPCASSGY